MSLQRAIGLPALILMALNCTAAQALTLSEADSEAPHLSASVQLSAPHDYINLRLRYEKSDAAGKPHLARMIGEAFEQNLSFDRATPWYSLASAAPGTDGLAARLGVVRMALLTDPVGAMSQLASLRREYPRLAVLRQLEGRVALVRNQPLAAIAALREAVALAIGSEDRDVIEVVQSSLADLSVAAAFAGNATLVASYAAASGLGSEPPERSAPTTRVFLRCDAASGVAPDDRAIFDVELGVDRPARVTAIWSNRPGMNVAALGKSLYEWRWDPEYPSVLGRGFRTQLACSPTGDYSPPSTSLEKQAVKFQEEAADWFIAKGLYPVPKRPKKSRPSVDADGLLAYLVELEKQYGLASPQLLPVLTMIIHQETTTVESAAGLGERALAIMSTAGAPVSLQAATAIGLSVQEAVDPGAWRKRAETILATDRSSISAEQKAAFRFGMAANLAELDPPAARMIVQQILATPVTVLAADTIVRRWSGEAMAEIADAEGRHVDADRQRVAVGAPLDFCSRADPEVALTGVSIGESDFPEAARLAVLTGTVIVQVRIDKSGSTVNTKVVYSQPPGLFEAATLKPFTGSRTASPPMRNGKPFACDRLPQTVRWKLANWSRPPA